MTGERLHQERDIYVEEGLAQWGAEFGLARVRERGGGLAAETDTGRGIVRGGFEPCLLAVLRLSVRGGTNTCSSSWFQRALARTGHLARAVELVYATSSAGGLDDGLVALLKTAADAGDLEGAQALAESFSGRQLRDRALVALVPAWARAGERDRAIALAESIRYPHNWGRAWAMLAKAVADNGDAQEALGFAARADELNSDAGGGAWSLDVLALLVEVAAAAGDHARAAALADRLESFVRSKPRDEGWVRPGPLAKVLVCEVLRGDLTRIDATLRRSPGPPDEALTRPRATLGGDLDLILLSDSSGAPLDAEVMTDVVDVVAETADQEVALALADRAQTLLLDDEGHYHDTLLRAVIRLLARRGQLERAVAFADWIDDPQLRAGQQADIVRELARYDDTARAEALAHAITDHHARARALIEVVREVARRGDTIRAKALTHAITDRWARGEALVAVVKELGRHGDLARAEAVASSIAYRETRARALAALVELAEPSDARRLAAQAVVLAGWPTVMPEVERVAPRVVATVADEMMSRTP
ncbi:hypothetical protein IQ62_20520 [Streptomyces scabiei]|uniref:hypothetical protein n=1 Tax=Streptomyces scabiei TaxID=1930 RepID=UPI0004E6FAA6|nr:hypothetical protein [Streptomyces scabiei]KFF99149.1 hypothetical protein IQ62_20520 [Streptomyces scabiei]